MQESPNPSFGDGKRVEKNSSLSQELMKRECKTLLSEIDRFVRTRHLMELRLKNVITLVSFYTLSLD